MLNEFVEKILVHEAEGARKGYGRTQKVEIYLNFIGKFNVPGHEEKEPEPYYPVDRRTKWRAYYHQNRENILAMKMHPFLRAKQQHLFRFGVMAPVLSVLIMASLVKLQWNHKLSVFT